MEDVDTRKVKFNDHLLTTPTLLTIINGVLLDNEFKINDKSGKLSCNRNRM